MGSSQSSMWSDLFYPGNPERRQRLTRKHQELLELMKNNFRATNQLIETLKKHVGLSFSPIAVNEKASVKENCEVIIARIREIQAEVEKIDTHLKEKLEPTLYKKLSVHVLTPVLYNDVFLPIIGVDMIAGAIGGSVSRDQLEKALEEYEKTLDEFRPASEQYQDSITYVRIRLEKN
ncbi:single-pass membrane and coiled-coil domain-containing protein 3-like [Pseudorasbora parva]|uniref:single-pass membrane and coiled-coil domain-containing protein 3-like n=1 Tax=Pseudorasbora parva TaxID=51549 RepID=UPI00351E2A89